VTFDDFTDVYEAMIDWDRRLGNEGPFYRRLFEGHGVQTVLDAACGTGRHAALFHSWGLRVEGADISPNMIDRARARFGEPPGLRWAVRGFDQPVQPAEPFDAVICAGNSLALAPDMATVDRAVHAMLAALRPQGVAVFHLLNLWRLSDGPCRWQKCRRVTLDGTDMLIVKGIHRAGSGGYVDLVVAPLDDTSEMRTDSAALLGIEADELERMTRRAGASRAGLLGGYHDEAYDREQSADLILVAEK
jgi:SAM-dependent methyltransferase